MSSNLPSNWDKLESEYNKHYDPYDYDADCVETVTISRKEMREILDDEAVQGARIEPSKQAILERMGFK